MAEKSIAVVPDVVVFERRNRGDDKLVPAPRLVVEQLRGNLLAGIGIQDPGRVDDGAGQCRKALFDRRPRRGAKEDEDQQRSAKRLHQLPVVVPVVPPVVPLLNSTLGGIFTLSSAVKVSATLASG